MADHKSKLPDQPDQSVDRIAAAVRRPNEIVPAESANEPSLLRTESIPPILPQYRTAMHRRHEKMPEEGAAMVRSGFAVASLMLGALAFAGCWTSAWSLIPAALAIILAPAGLFSQQRRWAIFGAILGLGAFGINCLWLSFSPMIF